MDEEGTDSTPLLGHGQEDALWDRVEQGPPSNETTVQQLLKERPEGVLRYLQRSGVRKLGEFCLPDQNVFGRLGDDSIVTLGSDECCLDYQALWREEMGTAKVNNAGWSTNIPVVAYVVTIKDAAKPDKEGLLQPLLRRWQAGGCSQSVFALPAVQAVIDWKWNRFCCSLLLWELAAFMVWLLAFSVFTIAFQDEDTSLSFHDLLRTSRGRVTLSMGLLSLLGMTPFLAIEAATIGAYGWGWLQAWNILDSTTYVLQVLIVVMHMGRIGITSNWLSVAAAVQCVLLLFRLQYFSRVFKPTRFAFVDSLKEVLYDVRWYLLFILIITTGFAAAFHILFRDDQKKHDEFSTIGKSFITMISWAAGGPELNSVYQHTRNPVAASLLAVTFVFVLTIVLMNLLIGILTNTLQKVTDNEGLRMLLSKAQVIDELESTIPKWMDKYFPQWMPVQLYPRYIHVLRVDPGRLDQVEMDAIWAEGGEGEESPELLEGVVSAQGAGSEAKEEEGGGGSRPPAKRGEQRGKYDRCRECILEEKVDAVWKELQELKALLRTPGGWHAEQ